MFDYQQKPTGTQYTITAALLIGAFIFSPAVLMLSRPFGYFSLLLALACSGICVALAWINWKRYSELTVASTGTQYPRAK